MRVLITGGAGFIGSHLSDYLITQKKIKKIIVLDYAKKQNLKNLKNSFKSNKFSFYRCDIRNLKKIIKYFKNIDIVFHLAALSEVVPSIEDPLKYLNTNLIGTVNILEAMRKHKVKKIIYTASSSCYGIPKKYPTDEQASINLMHPYSLSKNLGEQAIQHWGKVYGINFVSLRLFNVYGIRSKSDSSYGAALGVFLKQKLSNHPFTIVGDGKQKRDFINVSDVVNALYLSINKKVKNKILNIGSGKPKSILEMVKILGGNKIFIPKRPGEPSYSHANISKAEAYLKWKPKVSFENGLKKVLENIFYWNNAPLWTKSKIKLATKNWFKFL